MKTMIKLSIPALLSMLAILRTSAALPPEPPRLTLQRSGVAVHLDWPDTPAARGYRLYYAVYPDFGTRGSIDLGGGDAGEPRLSEAAFDLWNGAAFYVWLTAYNADGESAYSNIEHFIIDNKIVAFLPNDDSGRRLQSGLQEALAGSTELRLETLFVDPNDNAGLSDLFFGNDKTPGYVGDPNVLALVTSTTAQTLALTYSRETDNPPLVISCTGTSTQLEVADNMLRVAPDNIAQGKLLAEALKDYALLKQQHIKYAVLLNIAPATTIDSFDLYDQTLRRELEQFTALAQSGGLDANSQAVLYAQLVGSFSYDGGSAGMDAALAAIDKVRPDVVLHIGRGGDLPALINKRPGFFWIGSDSSYAYETYQGKNAAVISMSGRLEDYGYDAGAFIKTVMGALSKDSSMSRQGLLAAARELGITYTGRTGTKGFGVTTPAAFDLLLPSAGGWVKVK